MTRSSLLGLVFCVLTLSILVATGAVLADDGEPSINIDSPADGDWFTKANVTVEGRTGTTPQFLVLDIDSLGTATSSGLVLDSGKLVYITSPYFAEEFDGPSLDLANWTLVGDSENYTISNGKLVLGIGSSCFYPLIVSADGSFPQDMDVFWEAEFRFKHDSGNRFLSSEGGGLTDSGPAPSNSHLATYHRRTDTGYHVYVKGASHREYNTGSPGWNTYTLRYDPVNEKYTAFLDGLPLLTFKNSLSVNLLWFGAPNYRFNATYPVANIDYARFWTFKGSWESDVLDLGAEAGLDGALPSWTTNAGGIGNLALKVAVSSDNSTWSSWTNVVDGAPASPVQGRYVRFRAIFSLPFIQDPSKQVSLSGIDLEYHYIIASLEYDHDGAGWTPMDTEALWSLRLNLSEDWNHLTLRVTDSRGVNNTTAIDLLLDTTPPTGTMVINEGEEFTNSLTVELTINASDTYGVAEMHVSYHPLFTKYRVYPYAKNLTYVLDMVSGPVELYMRFNDTHGILSEAAYDDIIVDMLAPAGSVVIDGGEAYTTSSTVTLTLEAYDEYGVGSLDIANDASFTEAVRFPGNTKTVEWDLGMTNDGLARVHVRILDTIGNSVVVKDSIEVYFPKALGSVIINEGAGIANYPNLQLDIKAPADLKAGLMQVIVDDDVEGTEWEVYATSKILILDPGDGTRTVSVRFEDFRGILSLLVSSTIVLDTTAPIVGVTIEDGSQYATSTSVKVTLAYDDILPPATLWVSNTDDLDEAQELVYADTFDWTLSAVEGEATIYVWAMDGADNVGHGTGIITYAITPPQVVITLSEVTNALDRVDVSLEVTDLFGAVEVQLNVDSNPTGENPWLPSDGELWADVTGLGDGEHRVHLRARNVPGLVSTVVTATFILDRTVPTLVITSPEDGKKLTQGGKTVKLDLQVDDGDGEVTVEYRLDGGAWVPVASTAEPVEVEMPSFGEHTVDVSVTDGAGNVATKSTTFTLKEEEESPGFGVVVAVGALAITLTSRRTRRSRS